MSVIYILLPVAILLATIAVLAFIRAVRGGQYDDLETPRWRILTEDDPSPPSRGRGSRGREDRSDPSQP